MLVIDRICFVIAFALAIPLLILGALGLFAGCSANFTLPPVLGVLPALAGWGICRAVVRAWRTSGVQGRGFDVFPPPST
jgi:hypothetical protein